MTFTDSTVVQKTGLFRLVHGQEATTTLGTKLPHHTRDNKYAVDTSAVSQRAEEVLQLTPFRNKQKERVDASRYDLRPHDAHFNPGHKGRV